MKIGLIDVDGHNFPNLALMKISAYHKNIGDSVEFYSIFQKYDKVYMSKVFTFSTDYYQVIDCDNIVKGGTGYKCYDSILPYDVEHIMPDYSLYEIVDTCYGFLTRGCPNKCPWCIVPKKEGDIVMNADITEFWNGQKHVVLLDNNVLAHKHGLVQIEKMIDLGVYVDFNQGLDARLITEEIASLLARLKWSKYIRLACDKSSQIRHIENAYKLLYKHGYRKSIFCYVLLNDFDDSWNILSHFKGKKWFLPHAQPYRDFENKKQVIPQWQKDMARWCNMKSIYNSTDFMDYVPRKNFKCSGYFN